LSKTKLLSITLAVIIIMNVVLISKIGDLNNRVQNLSHNYNNLGSSINSVTSNVNQSLDRFIREQSWITPVQINHEKSKVDTEQVLAVFNWQIKDYLEESEVVFHYRLSDTEEFTTVVAESINTGFFEVSLPLEIKAEPSWEVNISRTEKGVSEQSIEQIAREIKQADKPIRCYVSMKTKDSIKSSEVSYINYEYLAHIKYEPVRGHVHIDGNQYNISLFDDSITTNNMESITAEFYNGNNLITHKQLERQDDQNGIKSYHLSYSSDSEDVSHIVLEVEYSNGDTFQKEIY